MTDYDDLFARTAATESLFTDKSALDPLAEPEQIVAHDSQQEWLARLLSGMHESISRRQSRFMNRRERARL